MLLCVSNRMANNSGWLCDPQSGCAIAFEWFKLITVPLLAVFTLVSVCVYIMFIRMLYVKRNDTNYKLPFFRLLLSMGMVDLFYTITLQVHRFQLMSA